MRSLLVVLLLALPACPAQAEPLLIGALAGDAGASGVRLAVSEANEAGGVGGRPVEALVEGTPTVEGARRLVEAGVAAVVAADGPPDPAVLSVLAEAGVPVLVAGAGGPSDGSVFRLLPTPGDLRAAEGGVLADLVVGEEIRTVAMVVLREEGTEQVASSFTDRLEAMGGSVELVRRYDRGHEDFAGLLEPISDLPVETGVVCLCPAPERAGLVGEAFHQALLGRPWYYAGEPGGEVPETAFPDDPGRLAGQRGVEAYDPEGPGFERFASSYLAEHGSPPTRQAALAYDAAMLAVLAAEQGGPSGAAARIPSVSRQGAPCRGAACLTLVRDGEDTDYQGAGAPIDLDDRGGPAAVPVRIWQYGLEGGIEILRTVDYRS